METLAERPLTVTERLDEIVRCRLDFWYYWKKYVKITVGEDIKKQASVDPYAGQRRIIDTMLAGRWPWILKGRRIGGTTAILTFFNRRLTLWPKTTCVLVSQDKPTAVQILKLYDDIDSCLPDWMRQKRVISNTQRILYGNASQVLIFAASTRTARAISCDLLLADEAAFMKYLQHYLDASEPSLETVKGLSAVVSTSDGPANEFCRGYKAAKKFPGEPYEAIFISWRDRPGRTDDWRKKLLKENAHRPLFVPHEYPDNDVEAFSVTGGRCFPGFSVGLHYQRISAPDGADRYRSIDFGFSMQHPTVCLWAWHKSDSIPRLTFDPDGVRLEVSESLSGMFPDGLEQMVAYRRKRDTGNIIKDDDDLPDALRYLLTTCRLTGHVHVYRVLFVRIGEEDGDVVTLLTIGRWIREMSGWVLHNERENIWRRSDRTETYARSIADVSGKGHIGVLRDRDDDDGPRLDFAAYEPIAKVPSGQQREAGVAWVNALLSGQRPFHAGELVLDSVDKHRQDVELGRERKPVRVVESWRDQMIRDDQVRRLEQSGRAQRTARGLYH